MDEANLLDRVINWVSPAQGLKRMQSRRLQALYRSSRSSRLRQDIPQDRSSADTENQFAALPMAMKARYFDHNNEHIIGGGDFFVASLVGREIITEPMVKRGDNTPHTELNGQIKKLWREFMKRPALNGSYTGAQVQRLLARTLFREGEAFIRLFEGRQYPHGTRVPLSLELLETDQLPHQLNDRERNIVQGVEKNQYSQPVAYHFYQKHPGDLLAPGGSATVRVAASDVLHVKSTRRFNQTRGVTMLHGIMDRAQDIDDIDRFEMAAAKAGASISLAIHRSADYTPQFDPAGNPLDRPQIEKFWPGSVLDGLEVGERAEMLNPNGRPNPHLEPFRDSHLRSMAAGTGLPFAAFARKYTGTYSAERQALVDAQRIIEPRAQDLLDMLMQPLYERFLQAAIVYGLLTPPWAEIDPRSLLDANHKTPKMPWIDPLKEVRSMESMVQAGFDSRSNQIRGTGRNPEDVRQEIQMETEQDARMGVAFTTSPDGAPYTSEPVTNAGGKDAAKTVVPNQQ